MKSNFCLTGLMIMVLFLSTSCTCNVSLRSGRTGPQRFRMTLARPRLPLPRRNSPRVPSTARRRSPKPKNWRGRAPKFTGPATTQSPAGSWRKPEGWPKRPKNAGRKLSRHPLLLPQRPNLTCDLSVSPASIMQGESAMLNWTSQNATECEIQPGIGPVKPQGTIEHQTFRRYHL